MVAQFQHSDFFLDLLSSLLVAEDKLRVVVVLVVTIILGRRREVVPAVVLDERKDFYRARVTSQSLPLVFVSKHHRIAKVVFLIVCVVAFEKKSLVHRAKRTDPDEFAERVRVARILVGFFFLVFFLVVRHDDASYLSLRAEIL